MGSYESSHSLKCAQTPNSVYRFSSHGRAHSPGARLLPGLGVRELRSRRFCVSASGAAPRQARGGRVGGVSRACQGRGQDGGGRAPRPSERPSLLHCSRRGAARLLTPNNGGSEPERRRRLRGWQRQRHPGPRRVPGVGPPGRQQHAG